MCHETLQILALIEMLLKKLKQVQGMIPIHLQNLKINKIKCGMCKSLGSILVDLLVIVCEILFVPIQVRCTLLV